MDTAFLLQLRVRGVQALSCESQTRSNPQKIYYVFTLRHQLNPAESNPKPKRYFKKHPIGIRRAPSEHPDWPPGFESEPGLWGLDSHGVWWHLARRT